MPSFSTPYRGIGSYLPAGYQETLTLPGQYLNRAITGAAGSIAEGIQRYAQAKKENEALDAQGDAIIQRLSAYENVMSDAEKEKAHKFSKDYHLMPRAKKLSSIFESKMMLEDLAPRLEAYANQQGMSAGQGGMRTVAGNTVWAREKTGSIDADRFAKNNLRMGQDDSIDAWDSLSPEDQVRYIAYQKQKALAEIQRQQQAEQTPGISSYTNPTINPPVEQYAPPSGVPDVASFGRYIPTTNIPNASSIGSQTRLPNQPVEYPSIALDVFGFGSALPTPPKTFGELAKSLAIAGQQEKPVEIKTEQNPTLTTYKDVPIKLPDSQEYVSPDAAKAMQAYIKAGGKSPSAFMQIFGQYAKINEDSKPESVTTEDVPGIPGAKAIFKNGKLHQVVPSTEKPLSISDELAIRSRTIEPATGYSGLAPGEQEAKEFRSNVATAAEVKDTVARLLEILDTKNKSFDLSLRSEASAKAAMLIGAMRVPIVGVGAMSEGERKLLEKIVSDPTKIFSIDEKTRASLNSLVSQTQKKLETQARSLGLKPVNESSKSGVRVIARPNWNAVTQRLE